MKRERTKEVSALHVGQKVLIVWQNRYYGERRYEGVVKSLGITRLRVEWRDYRGIVHNTRVSPYQVTPKGE